MKSGGNPAAKGGTPGFGMAAVLRYADEVRRYIDRRLRRPQEVDDLAQEVYLRLLQMDPHTQVREPLAFVYGIAANVLSDHWRRNSDDRFPSAGDVAEVCAEVASEALTDRVEEYVNLRQELEEALRGVSPIQAAAIILHSRDGLSYEEVAVELELSVHTVKKYLTQGRAQIRMKICE